MTPENDIEIMSNRLAKAMDAKRLNSSQLAARVEVTRSAMSLFLSGKRRPGRMVLAKLADELSVTVDFLLGRTDELSIDELLENPRIVKLVSDFIELTDADQKRVLEMIDLIRLTGNKATRDAGVDSIDETQKDAVD